MSKRHASQEALEQSAASSRKPGATWWGRRWIAALEHGSRDVVARLGKGRAYARDGHVHGLQIEPGQVRATVTDDELDSHRITLKLEAFDDQTWSNILQHMSESALNAAQLLNGEMPRDIDQVFRACGKSLFPVDHHEIDADCSCEDWTSPCKHVAATHYVLGDALDHDPFLLFELRGRRKDQVLEALDRLRGHARSQSGAASVAGHTESSSSCALSSLSARQFEMSEHVLPVLSFHIDLDESMTAPNSLLRSLGKPASWNVAATPQELLDPALAHARHLAITLASGSGHVTLKQTALNQARKRRK
jgi:uncharacterized Zn finger protein